MKRPFFFEWLHGVGVGRREIEPGSFWRWNLGATSLHPVGLEDAVYLHLPWSFGKYGDLTGGPGNMALADKGKRGVKACI